VIWLDAKHARKSIYTTQCIQHGQNSLMPCNRTRMASQRPFVQAVLPVWNHIKMIYCDSFLNFESEDWRFQCQWWWWRQHKLPQNYVWSPEWLSITRRLGLCVHVDLFFVLD
jgi:hypothetical protein